MPENIATLASSSNVLDTQAKWLRVMEKAGVTHEQFVLPINNRKARRNLAAYLAAGCPELSVGVQVAEAASSRTASAAYQTAVTILGDDFITPQEVAETRSGVVYTENQLAEFEKTLPAEEELKWLRDNGFMLVPGPGTPLSCLEIRALDPKYFYTKTGGWYAEEKQQFSRHQVVSTKWLKLRKAPMPDSLSRTWDEQVKLLSELEYVPNDAEVEWGVTTYMAVNNVYLLKGVYVRTSSLASDGRRVYVGRFDADGLNVDDCSDDSRSDNLGVASARK
jgi:hypothetical protein